MTVFIIVVDGTIVNVALPTLFRELGANTSQLQWIVDAYVLVFAGLLMAAGSIGDRFGRKGTLQAGLALFALTSFFASQAGSPGQLIVWRAAMGIGGALIFPATLALLVNVFKDPKQRAAAIAVWAATSGLAVALGPVSGGFLLEHFWWGSIFMVNLPIIAVAMVMIWRLVPTSKDSTIHRFDPIGTVMSIAGISLLVWAVIEGPQHGWTSTTSVGAFIAAALLLTGFIAWERRSDHPMLDVSVFTNMRFTAGSVSVTFAFFALMGFVFMVTQYFQFVRGYSTLGSGVRTVPFAIFTGIAAPMAAKLAERFGTKLIVAAGLTSMAVGFLWVTRDVADTSYWVVVGQMFFMGGGLGLVNAPATEAIMGSLPPDKAGVGSAVNDTARELGSTLGVAIVGSLFASVYASKLGSLLSGTAVPASAVTQAKDSVGAAIEVANQAGVQAGPAAGQAVKHAVDSAFVDGFHAGSWVAAGVVFAGALIALRWLPRRADAAASDGAYAADGAVDAVDAASFDGADGAVDAASFDGADGANEHATIADVALAEVVSP
jgi:EmrB/QacA subfamily drug resistance transporter